VRVSHQLCAVREMRTKDALWGPTPLASLAEIYVMVGDYDAALDELEYLLTIPSLYSINWLRLACWRSTSSEARLLSRRQDGCAKMCANFGREFPVFAQPACGKI
jgi:hypothetical protein